MYFAYITTLKGIRKHSNADRLQCATVFGANVIIDLSYYDGQKVVYFPIDGQLSEEFAEENNLVRKKDEDGNNIGGYLDPDKRNIVAVKLRGERSEGLILPIQVLEKYTDISKLKDGDKINTLNGHEICKKYIPVKKNSKSHQPSGSGNSRKITTSYPFFKEHTDTAQLAYNESAFHEGDLIVITRKLHGTSFRVSNAIEVTKKKRHFILKKVFKLNDKEIKRFRVVSGTRRTILNDYDGGYYGSNNFRKKYNDMLVDKLPKGMTVYGEIVGWVNDTTPIMPRCNNKKTKDKEFIKMYGPETVFTYGCEPGENDCYIYRITMTNEDGEVIELSTTDTMTWCEKLGLKFVPFCERFFYTTWEDLNERCQKYLDIPEPLSNGKHVTEGVVVRLEDSPTFKAFKTKSWAFKVLEGLIKAEEESPDMEEAEELIE